MDDRTFDEHVSKIHEFLYRICREFENKASNSGILLWYNLAGDDRYRIHVPNATGLEEIYHLQIRPIIDHLTTDETDVLVFIDRESEILSVNIIGLIASNLERWHDFSLELVNYDLLDDVISEILLPILDETE